MSLLTVTEDWTNKNSNDLEDSFIENDETDAQMIKTVMSNIYKVLSGTRSQREEHSTQEFPTPSDILAKLV